MPACVRRFGDNINYIVLKNNINNINIHWSSVKARYIVNEKYYYFLIYFSYLKGRVTQGGNAVAREKYPFYCLTQQMATMAGSEPCKS